MLPLGHRLPLLTVGPELGNHLLWGLKLGSWHALRCRLCLLGGPRLGSRLRLGGGLRLGCGLPKGLTQQGHQELIGQDSIRLGGNSLQSRISRYGMQGCELLGS